MLTNTIKHQAGVTLIELMIAVSIIGILAAMAIPSYRTWIENSKIRTAAESIQTGLQKARAEAVKRNTPVSFVLNANSAWTLSCVTASLCPDLSSGILEVRTAKDGSSADISVTETPTGSTTIVFTNFGTVAPTPTPFTQIDLDNTALSADSRPLRITIGAGGASRMCDPALASTDPRSC